MPVPSRERILRAFVYALSDRKEHHLSEIKDMVSHDLKIDSDSLLEEMNNGSNRYYYRLRWAGTHLEKARLVKRVKTGIYQIDERGIQALNDKPSSMSSYLMQFEEFRQFRLSKGTVNVNSQYNSASKLPHNQDITLVEWLGQDEENGGAVDDDLPEEGDLAEEDSHLEDEGKSKGKSWTKDETVLALFGYTHIPFSKIVSSNPEIIKLAKLLHRTPGSVSMKLCNFAALDKSISQKGLTHGSELDKEVWNAYESNNDLLLDHSENIYKNLKEANNYKDRLEMFNSLDIGSTEKTAEVKVRTYQSRFRAQILGLYSHACCITGLMTDCMLEAAHIIRWADDKENRCNLRNGLCLNILFHGAYDNHLVSISPDYVFHVHKELIECDNNKDPFILQTFMHYDNKSIYMPERRQFKPDRELLDAHYQRFKDL